MQEGESQGQIDESSEIHHMVDLPTDAEHPSTVPRNRSTKSFTGNASTVRQRNGGQGTIRQQQSGAVRAIKGLRFLDDRTITGKEGDAWRPVEKRFNQHAEDRRLPRDKFGACIGMGDSKEFAGELFDTLARRRKIDATNGITLGELRMFWEDMTNHDTDARLQIFFDMCDKNGDGKLSEEEVKEVILMSASVNKLTNLKQQSEAYAALIMEELDPDHLGYIVTHPKNKRLPTTIRETKFIKFVEETAWNLAGVY